MKKFLLCLMAAVAMVGMTGCSKGESGNDEPEQKKDVTIVKRQYLMKVEATPLAYQFIKMDLQYFGNVDTTVKHYSSVPSASMKTKTFTSETAWEGDLYDKATQVTGYSAKFSLKDSTLLNTLGKMSIAELMSLSSKLDTLCDAQSGLYFKVQLAIRYTYSDGSVSDSRVSEEYVDWRGGKEKMLAEFTADFAGALQKMKEGLNAKHSYAVKICTTNDDYTSEAILDFWADPE